MTFQPLNYAAQQQHDDDLNDATDSTSHVHIRIQQRNTRKSITSVQGIPDDTDKGLLLKCFKKEFNCNGTVIEDPEVGLVIQLQGDQRSKVYSFLITKLQFKKSHVKMHGF